MNTRITSEMREALEAESERTGQTLSQVAALWLEAGAVIRQLDPMIAAELLSLGRFAAAMEKTFGHKPAEDALARDALLAGWKAMVPRLLPNVPESPEGMKMRMTRVPFLLAARAVLSAEVDADLSEDEPVTLALLEHFKNTQNFFATVNQLPGGASEWNVWRLIKECAEGEGSMNWAVLEQLKHELPGVIAKGPTLREPLTALLTALEPYHAARWAYTGARSEAVALGEKLAAMIEEGEPVPAA